MTAQGGDLLAWLDAAITHHESEARAACHRGQGRWKAGHRGNSYAVSDEVGDVVVYNEGAPSEAQTDHIALNDPASVLRRCAADRKLMGLHNTPGNVFPDAAYMDDNRWCVGCGYGNDGEPMTPDVNDCPTLHALALGYGWTEGER